MNDELPTPTHDDPNSMFSIVHALYIRKVNNLLLTELAIVLNN